MTSCAPAALKPFSSTGSLPGWLPWLPFLSDCMGGFSLLNQEILFLPFSWERLGALCFVGVSPVWFSISLLISFVSGSSFWLPLHLFASAVVELYRVARCIIFIKQRSLPVWECQGLDFTQGLCLKGLCHGSPVHFV